VRLFAAAVILCEGPTEVGALPRWWRGTSGLKLRDPEAANIPIVSVGGDKWFRAYVRYLDDFGAPWAIVADGPALRRNSAPAKRLGNLKHRPRRQPNGDEFARAAVGRSADSVLLLEAGAADGPDTMAVPPAWPSLIGSEVDWGPIRRNPADY
jgi:hypothetical protein